MKKIKVVLLMLALLVFFPITAKALTGDISVTCTPSEVNPGGRVACLVKGSTADQVTQLEAGISLSDGLTIESFNLSGDWQGNDFNNSKIEPYVTDPVTGIFDIGTLNIKVLDNAQTGIATVNINNGTFYLDEVEGAANGGNATFSIVPAVVEPLPKGLSSLGVTNGTLSPLFENNRLYYTIMLESADVTTFSITAVPANVSDTFELINSDTNDKLNASNIIFDTTGGNETMFINLNVGAGDNLVTYGLLVRKPAPVSIDAPELATLKVGNINVTLIDGQYNYDVVLDDVSRYTVEATLKDSENYEFDAFYLNASKVIFGETELPIQINPKDSTKGLPSVTYIINVKKRGGSSSSSSSYDVGTVTKNPSTGEHSAFIMGLLLIVSLVLSIHLYRKNMNGYNN